MRIITEGKAKFYASVADDGKISKELDVFYNPLMKFNRDVTVSLIKAQKSPLSIAEIMAGSGVRALRILAETPKSVSALYVNDMSSQFKDIFSKNIALNHFSKELTENIFVSQDDANKFLLESKGFDYIDVDPFGSPNDFLNNAIIRVSRGGILAVTATDTAPLCGTYPKTCERNYWAKPLHNHLMHEVGLRIFIRKIQLTGSQFDRALIPMLSYGKDHYFRVFFRVEKSKLKADDIIKQHAFIRSCFCGYYDINKNSGTCSCGKLLQSAGPMWIGQLHDTELVQTIISDFSESSVDSAFIQAMIDELTVPNILFYDIHHLAKSLKIDIPKFETVMNTIRERKYVVSRTHLCKTGIKTTMPVSELRELLLKLSPK